MNNFYFLQTDFPNIFESANKAIETVHNDPRTACFYVRRALELTINWLYKHDNTLTPPYQDNLSALIHEQTFRDLVGEAVFNKAKVIIKIGNQAVHSSRSISIGEAIAGVKELFHVTYWLAHTYGRNSRPEPKLTFDPETIPKTAPVPKQTLEQLQKLEKQLQERDEKLLLVLRDKNALDEELNKLREEIAQVKKANISRIDSHDYSEVETRNLLIDQLLFEAGWKLDQPQDRTFKVTGMPSAQGNGFVDYILWGDDGKPLGLVEAKRTKENSRIGQQQAKLYADCLETQFSQRPLIFYSNGYEHYFWDDLNYPPRQVQGFYKKAELELLIQRRTTRKALAKATINTTIVERYYQTRAINRTTEAFERDKSRKALLVMATGAGKTRTAIALVDLMMRCNWVKRVLFLADRVALVKQTINVFKKYLPSAAAVNLVTDKNTESRVFASTYPTMIGLIEEIRNGQRPFGVGHFDLIIIDEAHRSVFQKYRMIFEYFDSLLLGLTATPKDELDRNTYGLFDLDNGVPTDAYDLEDAVKDGYLVPSVAVSVPLKFPKEGISYDQLSPQEQEEWDSLEWDEEHPRQYVEAEAVNKWLFNKDTVDKVLEHLMTRGLTVAGGDRLGKTIIFAKTQEHANFIAERFDINYPHYQGEFARVITFKTKYAQTLIDDFSHKDKNPHIAISVDMLDTGIDIPEIVNLVLFKVVRSKTKFWQMLGRGTRLCPELFSLEKHKEFFYLFDYCQNLEFFNENLKRNDTPLAKSLSENIFTTRLELIKELDLQVIEKGDKIEPELRQEITSLLQREVTAMNIDNFIVRPKRRLVEKYTQREAWITLSEEDYHSLTQEVAGLPSEQEYQTEETKRFDLLILKLQLALLRSKSTFKNYQKQIKTIAELLEEKSAIPLVQEQLTLIQDLQTDQWWQNVTGSMLEVLRKRLRDLIKLIEKQQRQPIYTDFEDIIGNETIIELTNFTPFDNFEKFRNKARAFLRSHQDNLVLFKLRTNKQLTPSDLSELERILAQSGVCETNDLERAKKESLGLGLFVRSLIGLDREVAKEEMGKFISGKQLNSNQIEFIDMIVNYLSEHGTIDPILLYESPFTDITPQGPETLFTSSEVNELIDLLEEIYSKAVAS